MQSSNDISYDRFNEPPQKSSLKKYILRLILLAAIGYGIWTYVGNQDSSDASRNYAEQAVRVEALTTMMKATLVELRATKNRVRELERWHDCGGCFTKTFPTQWVDPDHAQIWALMAGKFIELPPLEQKVQDH